MRRSTGELDLTYRLEDRFEREAGRAYLTGWDAIVRLPLMQRRRDQAAGLRTAGFVSGYPGSPLGGVDSLFREQPRTARRARHSLRAGNERGSGGHVDMGNPVPERGARALTLRRRLRLVVRQGSRPRSVD